MAVVRMQWHGDATRLPKFCGSSHRASSFAWLTLKGPTKANAPAEFEYLIPMADADAMKASLVAGPFVEKVHYRVEHAAHVWEIDEFGGDNTGLVAAEIELQIGMACADAGRTQQNCRATHCVNTCAMRI